MKKISILLLLFVCVQSGFAQEKFVDILDSLTARNHNTKTKIETEHSDYFEMMRNKQNFHLPQYNQSVIYLNSYKNYSVYMMVWDRIFSDEELEKKTLFYNSVFDIQAILFDNDRSLCYLLKYGDEGHQTCFSFEQIEGNEIVYIATNFTTKLSAIVRLDNNLRPIFGTKININHGAYLYNELDALYEYTQCQDSLYYKRLKMPTTKITEITDVELIKLLSAEHGYTEYQDSDLILEDEFALFKIGDD